MKWLDKFRDEKIALREIEDTAFADDCNALRFQMDCGKLFNRTYHRSRAFDDYNELKKMIDSVDEAYILGSAIFSKWRYLTHWAMFGENIISHKNRLWFITALSRLKLITAPVNAEDDRIEKLQLTIVV